jgi:ubiquinone/menaquinone biosynthesis C-methylase UbiE
MTWEETIHFIRTKPEYSELVEQAYFDENLSLNVERFKRSEEYKETLRLIQSYAPDAKSLLDIGSGNGISSIAFALDGYSVTVSEPDPSDTVGAGAIQKLKTHYRIASMDIHEDFAENIKFENAVFDMVYIRQAMHHANDLQKFIAECSRVLKPGGILFTVRDHVVYDAADKQAFLLSHPLQKFYGGENAYTASEYKSAMTNAGLRIVRELRYYDSVINYFPLTQDSLAMNRIKLLADMKTKLQKKIGFFAGLPYVFELYKWKNRSSLLLDEKKIAGRMYSYIAQKNE